MRVASSVRTRARRCVRSTSMLPRLGVCAFPPRTRRTAMNKSPGVIVDQIPVDALPGHVTEITFNNSGLAAFRTIVMNNTTVGSYVRANEYWYTRHPTLSNSVVLHSSSSTYSSTDLDRFHADCTLAFRVPQIIGTSGWTQGVYT